MFNVRKKVGTITFSPVASSGWGQQQIYSIWDRAFRTKYSGEMELAKQEDDSKEYFRLVKSKHKLNSSALEVSL